MLLLAGTTSFSVGTSDGPASQCPQVMENTCLPTSMPILNTTTGINVSACCEACVQHKDCISWTLAHRDGVYSCYLRESFDNHTVPSPACTSGQVRQPPPPPPPAPPGAPNVLLLLVDDLRPWLPFYGAEKLVAPNLQKLAQSGVQFNNTYVQQAVCSPTRNSFMSGRTPDHTRLWNFQGSFRTNGLDSSGKTGDQWRSLPQVFKEAGWITAGVGKTFHPGSPKNWDSPKSWTLVPGSSSELLYPYVDPPEQIGAQGTLVLPSQAKGNLDNVTGNCCTNSSSVCGSTHPAMSIVDTTVCNMPDELTTDYETASIAIDRLKNLTMVGKPWFLAVGLHKPHPYWPLPIEIREQYLDLPLPKHKTAPIGMPPVAFVSCDYLQRASDVEADVLRGQGILPNTTLSDNLARKIRSGYAAGVTWMDQQAGRILDELDRLHQEDKTIVLFTADHGWGLGEHGIWCKYCVFENQVRVPLLVRVPWLPSGHGQTTSALTESVDIMPTLADLAGILPKVMATEALDGISFVNVLSNPSAVHKEAAFSQYPRCMNSTLSKEPPYTPNRDVCVSHPPNEFTHMGLSVRTDDYRYSEWFRWAGDRCAPDWSSESDGIELYSHVGDTTPGCFDCFEDINLAANASGRAIYASIITAHRKLVIEHFQKNETACPPPVDAEEQAGVDMTFERTIFP